VEKAPHYVERPRRPCTGYCGEKFLNLILQASDEANRLAVRRGETIPDAFPMPAVYQDRRGIENIRCKKELKNFGLEIGSHELPTPAHYHYVIRATECNGTMDTGTKRCEKCTEMGRVIRDLNVSANKELNVGRGVPVTKVDVARLVTSPELIQSTIRKIRDDANKELKMVRKELKRLRERTGIKRATRGKPSKIDAQEETPIPALPEAAAANPRGLETERLTQEEVEEQELQQYQLQVMGWATNWTPRKRPRVAF
jgi:hypothetical protein